MTYQLVYSSQASRRMSMADLEEILVDARSGNEKRNITGVLVYVDGVFLQILEGDKETVLGVMRSISADSRHTSVKVFHEVEIDARAFGNWRMAYLSATPEDLAAWAELDGTASIESVLETVRREPRRVSQMIETILSALAP